MLLCLKFVIVSQRNLPCISVWHDLILLSKCLWISACLCTNKKHFTLYYHMVFKWFKNETNLLDQVAKFRLAMLDTKLERKQKRNVTFVIFIFFPLSHLWQLSECLLRPCSFQGASDFICTNFVYLQQLYTYQAD